MAAADDVIAAIDQAQLAIYLAQKCPEEGPGAAKRKKGGCAGARLYWRPTGVGVGGGVG